MVTPLPSAWRADLTTLAAQINAEHEAAERAIGAALDHAREAGELLLKAKEHLAHGEWGAWLDVNFRGSDRTARLYMRIARHWPELEEKRQGLAVLGIEEACKLLAEPRSAAPALPEPWVAHNTGNVEWYTPEPVLKAARTVLGAIDVDPASHEAAQERVRAARYYTAETDGLAHEWHGRIWLNPPYAYPLIERFVEKLLAEWRAGRTTAAIVLTNNGTETRWAQALLAASALVCLPSGRLRYWTPQGDAAAALQGQMLCYLGREPERFRASFNEWGAVLRPIQVGEQ